MGAVKGRTSLPSSPMCEAVAFLGGACWPSSLPITGARCAPSKAAVATTENPAADANALRAGVSGVRPLAAKTLPAVEVRFLRGRVRFGRDGDFGVPAPALSAIVIFRQSAIEAQSKEG